MPLDVKAHFCIIPKGNLSDFTIIGEGGFGYVYKARHVDWGIVAVKSLKAEHVADRHKKNLQAEAEKLSRLNHQNIVQLYGVVLEAGNYSVVLEYVEHGNLDDFINTYKVPWNLKTKMIYSIVLGMNYLHTQTPPMIHRDLKSQNLLVTAGFECKITDFGLSQWNSYSRQHTSHSKSHTQGGTVTHIPPEVWEDCNYTSDAKCDVYAMGILLWEIVTEKIPFEGLMDAQISLSVCRGQRPDNRLVPNDAPSKQVLLIDLCWHQDPVERPTFAEMKRILDEEVTTGKFQDACEQATLHLMREISEERSKTNTEMQDGTEGNMDIVCAFAENLHIEQNQSDKLNISDTLPYPVQKQTPSLDSKKLQSGVCEDKFNSPANKIQKSHKTCDQTGIKNTVQNRGYVRINESQVRHSPRKTMSQKSGVPRGLPSDNLQTDAAPTDAQPWQETGKPGASGEEFNGKEYLKKSAKSSPGPHTKKSYRPMPPPGAGPGPFPPNFMDSFSMQPSMVIKDSGSGSKTVQLYNMAGVTSSMNVQVGNNNTMHITNTNDGRSQAKPYVNHRKITKSTNPIDEENMRIVAKNIGKPWMELGRHLGFSEGQLEAIENDYRHHGHVETVYQMLLQWKKQRGKHNCKLVTVAEKLVKMEMAHVAAMLVTK